ncbi:MAG: hypothetical protein K8U57_28625 [Planctomycetes bacterium]|nr:hypothetical protein [Planctomycetota bacterium]
MPGKPTNLELFGATPDERERSRGESSIRVSFGLVADADYYTLRINGVVGPNPIKPGDVVPIGKPNTLARIDVRAEKKGQPPSDWVALKTVTRPPRPVAPVLLPFELSEFGVMIAWTADPAFPGGDQATMILLRDGVEIAAESKLTARKLDASYRLGVPHRYSVRIVVPKEAVPDGALGGLPNPSFPSDEFVVSGPIRRMSARQTKAFLNRIRAVEVTILGRLYSR